MNNIKSLFNLGFAFSKKYLKQYFTLLKKPTLLSAIGLVFLSLCIFGTAGAILASLISIPCLCYALWQGYLTTYSLNYAADALETNNDISLNDCFEQAKLKAKEFALFLLFAGILHIILMLPSLSILFYTFDLTTLKINMSASIAVLINSLLLIPFSNFLNQAFFYKNNNESFFDLFLNCYKKLDKTGIVICILFSVFMGILYAFNSILYIILALIFNPLIYCINTLWYKSKTLAQQEF